MTTLKELQLELEPYKNTLVLADDFKVYRLVDVIYDESDKDWVTDYFWVYDYFNSITWHSCVGGWTPLKGIISDNDYKRMVNIWNLNNHEKAI